MAKATHFVQSSFMKAVSIFFEYDTPKIVHIRSKKVGVINRLIQIVLLAYIIGYAIVWEKGYQDIENIVSVSTTKVKGTIFTNTTKLPRSDPRNYRIWDVADYVNPPQETNAFFVTTNVVVTENQTQEVCPEDPTMSAALCEKDSDCPQGVAIPNGNGVRTGRCVQSDRNKTIHVCEIHAWCPVETDVLPLGDDEALLADSKTFTVLIKNNIEFPKFGIKRRNILDSQNGTYLKGCRFNSSHVADRLCPIFELGYLVAEAGEDYDKMAVLGGVIGITINWNCNLDHSIDSCRPVYKMRRLDPEEAKISQGWNFRYANYYEEEGVMKRDLHKVNGIRFVIMTTGQAGKFSLVPLLLSLGSGMGLLAIATVLCDIIVMYVLKKGPFYQEKKYFYVTDDDAFQTDLHSDDDSDEQTHLLDSDEERQTGLLNNSDQPGYNTMDDVGTTSSTTQDVNNQEESERAKKRKVNTAQDEDKLID